MKIAIAVVAFDKIAPLKRLLQSISCLDIPSELFVDICFCIDGGGAPQVKTIIEEFQWHGNHKKIFEQSKNIGLKQNVYSAMKLGYQYDATVILEDDLYVSPSLLKHAQQLITFYQDDPKVSAISLYSPSFNETAYCNFTPIKDGFDVFFMKVPSSWGQVYTKRQISNYFKWHQEESKKYKMDLPANVERWSAQSWKKEFFHYLICTNSYLVVPRDSLTTNYADIGQHQKGSHLYQVPLSLSQQKLKLVTFNSSKAIYDEYCEVEAQILKNYNSDLATYDFTVNLYGFKKENTTTTDLVLSTIRCNNSIMSWDDSQKPLEMNCINNVQGEGLYLYNKNNMHYSLFKLIKARLKGYYKQHNIKLNLSLLTRILGRN